MGLIERSREIFRQKFELTQKEYKEHQKEIENSLYFLRIKFGLAKTDFKTEFNKAIGR